MFFNKYTTDWKATENKNQCKKTNSNNYHRMGLIRLRFCSFLIEICLINSVAPHLKKYLFFLVLFSLRSPSKYCVTSVRCFPSNNGTQRTTSYSLKPVSVCCCLCLEDAEAWDQLSGFCLFTDISGTACSFL